MRMWQGAVGSSRYNGIVSPAYVVARPCEKLDPSCFGYLLKQPAMLYKFLCDSQGNSKDTQTLRYERFAEIEATVPPSIEEQRIISACLGSIESLITLHQREYSAFVHPKTERAKEIETAVSKVSTSFWLEVSYLALVPNAGSS